MIGRAPLVLDGRLTQLKVGAFPTIFSLVGKASLPNIEFAILLYSVRNAEMSVNLARFPHSSSILAENLIHARFKFTESLFTISIETWTESRLQDWPTSSKET